MFWAVRASEAAGPPNPAATGTCDLPSPRTAGRAPRPVLGRARRQRAVMDNDRPWSHPSRTCPDCGSRGARSSWSGRDLPSRGASTVSSAAARRSPSWRRPPETAIEALDQAGRLTWVRRGYAAGDLDGAWYVMAATDDPAVNAAVGADAEALRVFCVRADRGTLGSAVTPAVGGQDGLQVGVLAGRRPPPLRADPRCARGGAAARCGRPPRPRRSVSPSWAAGQATRSSSPCEAPGCSRRPRSS